LLSTVANIEVKSDTTPKILSPLKLINEAKENSDNSENSDQESARVTSILEASSMFIYDGDLSDDPKIQTSYCI
jgi:hypothetical protein